MKNLIASRKIAILGILETRVREENLSNVMSYTLPNGWIILLIMNVVMVVEFGCFLIGEGWS